MLLRIEKIDDLVDNSTEHIPKIKKLIDSIDEFLIEVYKSENKGLSNSTFIEPILSLFNKLVDRLIDDDYIRFIIFDLRVEVLPHLTQYRGFNWENFKKIQGLDSELEITDFMFSYFRNQVDNANNTNQFIMPYYMDFRKRGSGVANVQDQLFFKENYSCAENNSFYERNMEFDPLKYPYLRGFNYSEKCGDIPEDEAEKRAFCENNPEGRFCYKTCCESSDGTNDKPAWCPRPEELRGDGPYYDLESNLINTDEYPIDIQDSILEKYKGEDNFGNVGRAESMRHGFFKVHPDYLDRSYGGYYIAPNNNNTKFNRKKNLFTELTRFFGTNTSHRASHNGICDRHESLSNSKNFCKGKNAYDPEFESDCNRVSKYRKDLYDSIFEKIEKENSTAPVNAPITGSVTESTETEAVQTTMSITDELDNLPELNFYIQPAKGEDGNIVKSDTYFHAHEHLHS